MSQLRLLVFIRMSIDIAKSFAMFFAFLQRNSTVNNILLRDDIWVFIKTGFWAPFQ